MCAIWYNASIYQNIDSESVNVIQVKQQLSVSTISILCMTLSMILKYERNSIKNIHPTFGRWGAPIL